MLSKLFTLKLSFPTRPLLAACRFISIIADPVFHKGGREGRGGGGGWLGRGTRGWRRGEGFLKKKKGIEFLLHASRKICILLTLFPLLCCYGVFLFFCF